MKDGITVGELIVLVEALKDRVERGEVSADTLVVRSDAEWGPRAVQDIYMTKVQDADAPEGAETESLDVVMIGNER